MAARFNGFISKNGKQCTKPMIYFALIFIPPAYFISRKKWGGFILNSILYGLACLCVFSIAGIMIAPFFWIISFIHAMLVYKKEATQRNINLLATKMAEKMRENPKA